MQPMSPRDRILAALERRMSDEIPLDIGGCDATSLNTQAYERLKAHLQIESPTVHLSRRTGFVVPDEVVCQRLGSAARMLPMGMPDRMPDRWLPNGSVIDQWNVVWRAADGHYLPVVNPLATATTEDLKHFAWPDPDDPGRTRGLREQAKRLQEETDCAIILTLPVGFVHVSQYLRGYATYLMDLIADTRFSEHLMDHVLEYYLRMLSRALDAVGEYVDVVMFGDDVAFQDRPMVQLKTYRTLIKPRHKQIIDLIKAKSKAHVLYHCCGAVSSLIGDFIEIGVDALNPVQVSATDMDDTAKLKREFGNHICFWGGIDTQHVMPRGTPEDVRREVNRRIRDLGQDGGYVVAAVHAIQSDVPPENIVAMSEAVRSFQW